MASKTSKVHIKKDMTSVKWVKKANMWAKTTILDNKQTVEWFTKNEKPEVSNGSNND